MRELIKFRADTQETLVDITPQVRDLVRRSGIRNGLVTVYAQGATAAGMIQENWDDSVQRDVIDLLRKLIPQGVWQHDVQDGVVVIFEVISSQQSAIIRYYSGYEEF